jgi:hypothetical protein
MKKNRKKADTYRFNGVWGGKAVKITDLIKLIEQFQAKLVDGHDPDDKKWTACWLKRFEQELAKKQKNLEQQQIEQQKGRRRLASLPACLSACTSPTHP